MWDANKLRLGETYSAKCRIRKQGRKSMTHGFALRKQKKKSGSETQLDLPGAQGAPGPLDCQRLLTVLPGAGTLLRGPLGGQETGPHESRKQARP